MTVVCRSRDWRFKGYPMHALHLIKRTQVNSADPAQALQIAVNDQNLNYLHEFYG